MNQNEFVRLTQDKFEKKYNKFIALEDLHQIIKCMNLSIVEGLKRDGYIRFKGWLQFNIVEPYKKTFYHPKKQTKEEITISRSLKATAGFTMRNALNEW